MKNNTVPLDTSVGSNQTINRQLQGKWLLIAKGVYIVSLTMVFLVQVFIILNYFQKTQELLNYWTTDFWIEKSESDRFIVTRVTGEVHQGVEEGNVILKINGVEVLGNATLEEVEEKFKGPLGGVVTLTIVKNDGTIQDIQIVRGKDIVVLLNKYRLTPSLFFWLLFGTVSLLLLSTTFVSLVIYQAFKTDWLVLIVALSQLFLPFALNYFLYVIGIFGFNFPQYIFLLCSKIGSALLLLTIYMFPDGQIYPKRIKWLLIAAVIFSSRDFGFNYGLLYGLLTLQIPLPYQLLPWLWILSLTIGVFVQIQKFQKTTTALEKQQIKWAMIGFLSITFVMLMSEVIGWFNLWTETNEVGFWELVLSDLSKFILLGILLLVSSIALTISIYRYKLWDADFYINRAIVYSLVTGIIAVTLIITVTILQNFLQQFDSQVSPLMIAVLSSIQITALFKPIRTWVEKWVNERFYKDRVNFVEAIVELQPEKWQFITTKDMLQLLVTKTPSLIKSTRSAIYLVDNKGFDLVSAFGIEKKEVRNFVVDPKDLEKLKKRKVVEMPNKEPFVALVPLTVPRGHENDLVGILALGAREKGRGYSRDHISDLADLGKSAGVAIHFLQLSENKVNS